MSIKVGLNGFGRIGRSVLRIIEQKELKDIEVVSINARANAETLAHLFKYDSCFGIFNGEVEVVDNDNIKVNGRNIKITRNASPKEIPWSELGVDIVIDNTGKFKSGEELRGHIEKGAKKVILTAPGKNVDKTIVLGVNGEEYDKDKHDIVSNASCTTNCLAPLVKVLDEKFGIVSGLMTTVHSYTNDQHLLDKTHKDLRRARNAGDSIIPTATGAAKALKEVIPNIEGKLNGFALRVPTSAVSLVDLVVTLDKDVSVEEVNKAFKDAAESEMKGVLGYSEEPLVSVDYKGNQNSSTLDALSTMKIGDNMLKIISWYDNEWGYSNRVVDLAVKIANEL